MQDIVYKSTIGTGGFIATIELSHINELLGLVVGLATLVYMTDRKSTRLNSSHGYISYAVFCLKKKKKTTDNATLQAHTE